MLSFVIFLLTVASLFSQLECRFYYRNNFIRRQAQQMFQNPQQIPETSNPIENATSIVIPDPPSPLYSLPLAYAGIPPGYTGQSYGTANFSPLNAGLPPQNAGLPPQNAGLPPQNTRIYLQNAGLPPQNAELPLQNAGLPLQNAGLPLQNAGLPLQNAGLSYGAVGLPLQNAELPYGLPLQNARLLYGDASLPLVNAGMFPQNAAMQSGNKVIPYVSANFAPQNAGPIPEPMALRVFSRNSDNKVISASTDVANYSQSASLSPLNENISSTNISSRRRRKNVPEKNNELVDLFEKGKKLLEVSTVTRDISDNSYLKYLNVSLADDLADDNTTLIPIPKGVQLKTVSKYNDSKVKAAMNITSNTQKTVSVDNSTEIENVVEMQLEKKIEDEKGANKGSEEIRIVETERVKPLFNKKGNTSTILSRKRKSSKKRFAIHHRSKRSTIVSEEVPRSKFVYNKMARRFLSVVRRKERVVEPNNFSSRRKITAFRNTNRKDAPESVKQAGNDLVYDKDEIDDFMKFFLKQMKKFRKSRENNNTKQSKDSCNDERCNNLTVSSPKGKKIKKSIKYPEHMNVFMNLNMTWDSKLKEYASKSLKVSGVRRNSTESLGITVTPFGEFTTQMKAVTLVYVGERMDTKFFTTILLFSAMTFLMTLSTLVLPKLYRMLRLRQMNSGVEAYRFCDVAENDNIKIKTYKYYGEDLNNKIKEPENDKFSIEDYPKLEWQCENGEWLS